MSESGHDQQNISSLISNEQIGDASCNGRHDNAIESLMMVTVEKQLDSTIQRDNDELASQKLKEAASSAVQSNAFQTVRNLVDKLQFLETPLSYPVSHFMNGIPLSKSNLPTQTHGEANKIYSRQYETSRTIDTKKEKKKQFQLMKGMALIATAISVFKEDSTKLRHVPDDIVSQQHEGKAGRTTAFRFEGLIRERKSVPLVNIVKKRIMSKMKDKKTSHEQDQVTEMKNLFTLAILMWEPVHDYVLVEKILLILLRRIIATLDGRDLDESRQNGDLIALRREALEQLHLVRAAMLRDVDGRASLLHDDPLFADEAQYEMDEILCLIYNRMDERERMQIDAERAAQEEDLYYRNRTPTPASVELGPKDCQANSTNNYIHQKNEIDDIVSHRESTDWRESSEDYEIIVKDLRNMIPQQNVSDL